MQKARSGLAAAAAKWQLMDAPEGESSLQSRLNEAERRAHDAETSAQDAQAALARTLLESARVEAVVMARIKAQSEAEIEALRSELDAMKQATSTLETTLYSAEQGDAGQTTPRADVVSDEVASVAAAGGEPDVRAATVAEAAADNHTAPSDEDAVRTLMSETTGDATPAGEKVRSDVAFPRLRVSVDDRPDWTHPQEEEPSASSNMLRFLPDGRVAFLSVVAVVAVASYLAMSSYLEERNKHSTVALVSGPGAADAGSRQTGVLPGTRTDGTSIAEASASLDAELKRLQALSRKVEALRTLLAARWNVEKRGAPALSERMAAADRAPAVSDANWLLYMPVERAALVQYLAGRSWPGIQMASQHHASPARQN